MAGTIYIECLGTRARFCKKSVSDIQQIHIDELFIKLALLHLSSISLAEEFILVSPPTSTLIFALYRTRALPHPYLCHVSFQDIMDWVYPPAT